MPNSVPKRGRKKDPTLARRRCDTLYAMLRDGTLYEPRLNPSGLTKTIEAPPDTSPNSPVNAPP